MPGEGVIGEAGGSSAARISCGRPTIAHAGTWPHSGDVIARDFKGGPEDVKAEMIGENAAKLDGLVA